MRFGVITMSDEFDQEESQGRRSRIWIWILILVLLALLLVPVVSIALAVKKTEWIPVKKHAVTSSVRSEEGQALSQGAGGGDVSSDDSLSLREKVEKLASTIIQTPRLRSKMETVSITAPPSTTTPFSVKEILAARHHQFVEAVDKDRVRLVVILPSKDWPELSGALEVAALKEGFLYSGPKATSGTPESSESMVAEIEIVRSNTAQVKPSNKQSNP